MALLARGLRDDHPSVAGPEYAIRRELLDFVVAELPGESACLHRIRPVRTLLENQREIWEVAGAIPADVGPEAVAS